MVKAFSYGNGSYEIAHHLEYHNVDFLAVAYIDEGVALRKKGITTRIMVLNVKVPSRSGPVPAMVALRSKPLIVTPVTGANGLTEVSSRTLASPCVPTLAFEKGILNLKAIENERDSPKPFRALAATFVAPSNNDPSSRTPSKHAVSSVASDPQSPVCTIRARSLTVTSLRHAGG